MFEKTRSVQGPEFSDFDTTLL